MLKLINDINIFSLSKRMNRPLILDGAMGSLLQQKGVNPDQQLWMSVANITHSDLVTEIHNDYIKAGADIITTNTFNTNPTDTKKNKKYSSENLVNRAVKCAKNAVGKMPVLIAGSNAPAEDCYQVERTISKRELEQNHQRHIDLLMENGVHFILNETHSHFDEILIISNYCDRKNIPYAISLFFTDKLKLLSGEKLSEILGFLNDSNALAVGFNCILPSTMDKAKSKITFPENWGLYLNCGDGSFTDVDIKCGVSPEIYSNIIREYLNFSPSYIGSCCGSSPEHIKELKSILDGQFNN
jgi:methionine synthase I (cobalamin-dependent)